MADVGLEAIEGQDNVPADLGDALEAGRVVQREGHQLVITCQKIGDRPWGHRHPAVDQGLMDVWDTAVVAVALLTNEGDDIETTLVLGERQSPFLFRAVGVVQHVLYTGAERRKPPAPYTGTERRKPSLTLHTGTERRKQPQESYTGVERRRDKQQAGAR